MPHTIQQFSKESAKRVLNLSPSWGGGKYQLGEMLLNPQLGYRYLGGVVPTPDVGLRLGGFLGGNTIGFAPFPYIESDWGRPSGWQGNKHDARSLYKWLQDGMRDKTTATTEALANIPLDADAKTIERVLRNNGVGYSSRKLRAQAEQMAARNNAIHKLEQAANEKMTSEEKQSAAFNFGARVKQAVSVDRGGLLSRALASTVGHLGGASVGLPILGLQEHVNPTQWHGKDRSWLTSEIADDDERAQKLKQITKNLEKVRKQELGDHQVLLGGTNAFKEIPRILKNKRTSILGKVFGLGTYLPQSLMMNALRGSHYNPLSDTSVIYGNSPAVLTHELGHALDFNERPVSKEKGFEGLIAREGGGLLRDGYMMSRAFAPIMLAQEGLANINSEDALMAAYKKDPQTLNKILSDRQRVLPAGFGSYLGGTIGAPLLGPAGPLVGLAAGKAIGLAADAAEGGKYVPENVPKKKKKAPEVAAPQRKAAAALNSAPKAKKKLKPVDQSPGILAGAGLFGTLLALRMARRAAAEYRNDYNDYYGDYDYQQTEQPW